MNTIILIEKQEIQYITILIARYVDYIPTKRDLIVDAMIGFII